MREITLKAEQRDGRGKGPARRLRAAGKIPATMYGGGTEPVALAVDARDLSHALTTEAGINALLDLHVGSDTHLAMARELSRDPVRGSLIHVDFLQVDRNKPIALDVPIHVEGEPVGVTVYGGVLEHHLWQLHISCLPTEVPERIDIDVSALGIGDAVRAGDVQAPAGVTILTSPDETIAAVVVPAVLKLEEEPEEAVLEGEEGAEAAAEGEEGAEAAAEGDASDES